MTQNYWRLTRIADRVHPDLRHLDPIQPWELLDGVWFLIAEQRMDQNFIPPRNQVLIELAAIGDMLQ